MPLLPVVWSAMSRPVTVTSPRGGGGTSGYARWSAAAGTQPRFTRTTRPSARTSGVSTCMPTRSSALVRRRTTTSWSVSNVPVAVTWRQRSSRGTLCPGEVSSVTGTGSALRLSAISAFWATRRSCRWNCQKPSSTITGMRTRATRVRITHCRDNRKRYTP